MEATSSVFIRAEDPADLSRWARKWSISEKDLRDAILHTGSLDVSKLKEYVHRDRWIYHPFSSTARFLKAGISMIF